MPQARAILFDFDGTLVQTRDSSWKLFCRTNEEFGLGVDTQQDYFSLLEDNMFAALKRRAGDEARGEAAARHFLDLLRTAYHPDLVPGMSDVVRSLAGNFSLAVLSSNSMSAIRRILIAKQIAHCFSHVFTGDVEPDKRATVRRFLTDESYAVSRACGPAYIEGSTPQLPSAEQVVLVTDTVGDVKHAKECGIRAIGVSWGMHSEDKLLAAGAEIVVLWPQEIVAYLLPGGFTAAVCACAPGQTMTDGAACECAPADPVHAAAETRRRRILASRSAVDVAVPGTPQPDAGSNDSRLRSAMHRISGHAVQGSAEPGTTRKPPASPRPAAPDPSLLRALVRLRPDAATVHRTAG